MQASPDIAIATGLPLLQRLVAEAAEGRRGGWTLDSTFDVYGVDVRRRCAQRRAALLQQFGHETQVVEEADTQAVYVWRRA